ncbi:choline kinase [Psychromonas sp. psych-6C06]|uniref:phosphotransferase n=1 Tax=Psychromonas sp. psych-6C06 TaxID=2058089 RepID=UPI000C341A68|nr:phosphotransferase [Psychromonas sp. psych-6C06]PKF60696.1 choline kinase [Psychromonas sp. psych-6C06]
MISQALEKKLLQLNKSDEINHLELIQGVWGGYGQLIRVSFSQGVHKSLVIKLINTPQPNRHPKGWNTAISHQRKLNSYQIESYWYQHYANKLQQTDCRVPRCLWIDQSERQQVLVLEDLSVAGFPRVKKHCSLTEAKTCLSWLAQFHVIHLQKKPAGLWPTGSYWHLATRPDELHVLQDKALKKAAISLDQCLAQTPYQTLIHGDAKLANFCFSENGEQVAAVDFQYVGQGCGMKDVILFISSAVIPEHCAQLAPILVDHYFEALQKATVNTEFNGQQLTDAWRPLYAIAWADFQRFVKGWSPNHWKINDYTETLTLQALDSLTELNKLEG